MFVSVHLCALAGKHHVIYQKRKDYVMLFLYVQSLTRRKLSIVILLHKLAKDKLLSTHKLKGTYKNNLDILSFWVMFCLGS